MRTSKSLSLLFLLFFACGHALPELEGIERDKWEADKNACGNARASMRDAIDRQKEKLRGLKQTDIVKLLGRPDQNELSKRNQKFFYYFLEPGSPCSEGKVAAERLVIRFNALGLAKEVLIE